MTVLVGNKYSSSEFYLHDVPRDNLGDHLLSVLNGKIPAMLVRDALAPRTCSSLVASFESSPCRRPRGDGVSGFVLGAYHYGQTFEAYASDIAATAACVRDFLNAGGNPVEELLQLIRVTLRPNGVNLRPARWRNINAALARALSWTASGSYMLDPHDDVGQLTDSRQYGFEAQSVSSNTVVAVNFYPRVPPGGGILRVWNIAPTQESRELLNIATTGYPIPPSYLNATEYIDIDVSSGSLVMMNGALVHAVTGYQEHTPYKDEGRLIINFFMGYSDPTTVVHWV